VYLWAFLARARHDLDMMPLQEIEFIELIEGLTRSGEAVTQNVAENRRRPEGRGRGLSNPSLSAIIGKKNR